MQLLLALLASAAVAVACLPVSNHLPKATNLLLINKKSENKTNFPQAVYPDHVIESKVLEQQKQHQQPKESATQKIKSAAPQKTDVPNMKYRVAQGGSYGSRTPPKTPTPTKKPTTTTTSKSFDQYDYQDDGNDPTNSKMTNGYDHKPLLCPGDGFMCQRDCESKRYYSGYCDVNTCICYGKLVK